MVSTPTDVAFFFKDLRESMRAGRGEGQGVNPQADSLMSRFPGPEFMT